MESSKAFATAAVAMDILTTVVGLSLGLSEANPFVSVIGLSMLEFMALKVIFSAFLIRYSSEMTNKCFGAILTLVVLSNIYHILITL